MRIVFTGASQFGLRCLDSVLGMPDVEVVGIITNERTFSVSYAPNGVTNVLYADFEEFAQEHGIPVYRMQKQMTETALIKAVEEWHPDLLLVVGWYHMVSRKLREIAPAVGIHASLLPDYSGGAPLVWAIINGEKKTGISFFLLDDGVDSGPIIGQLEEEIRDDDTIGTLYRRIEELGVSLLKKNLAKLASGTASFVVQDESRRRIFPQRSPRDGKIEWRWDAVDVYNFIRAQTRPYPGAFTFWQERKMTIWAASLARVVQGVKLEPGGMVIEDNELIVGTGNGLLRIHDFEIDCEDNVFSLGEIVEGKLLGSQYTERR